MHSVIVNMLLRYTGRCYNMCFVKRGKAHFQNLSVESSSNSHIFKIKNACTANITSADIS